MSTILGYVQRVSKRDEVIAFYKAIGINVTEHAHGGPLHHVLNPLSIHFAFEVYKASDIYPAGAVIIGVDNLERALRSVEFLGVKPERVLGGDKGVYVKDPDGNDVLLQQI